MTRALALLSLSAAVAAIATTLAAAGQTAPAPDQPGRKAADLAAEAKLASRISSSAARAMVRRLVSYGPRTGGTASGDRAAAAVAARLRRLGLAVEVMVDPPRRTHEESSWKVALGDRALASAWPWSFSPSIAATRADLVLDRPSSPEGAGGLAGTVVLSGGNVTGDFYGRMVKAGVLAVLTDAPGDPNRFTDWAPIGSIETMEASDPPIPVFGLSYHDGRRLRGAIASSAGQAPQVTVALASRLGKGRPRTVIGTLAGAGARKDRIMIVCAHGDSDSGGPGADDNASGVATLLEVARALSSAAADGLLPADRPQVRFIVWGAEYHSSRAWVESHGADLDRLDAVINYDETGTGAERDAVYFEGNDIPWNAPLLRTLESVASDHAGRPGFPTAWTSNPALGGTDAYVFLPRRYDALGVTDARIPSTTVFTAAWDLPTRVPQTDGWRSSGWDEPGDLFVDYSAYYHSSGDIPARTTEAEPWNMERCASLVVVALYRLMRSQGAGAAADTPGAVRAPGRPR